MFVHLIVMMLHSFHPIVIVTVFFHAVVVAVCWSRELLIEFCRALDLVVANTFQQRAVQNTVTYFDLTATPHDPITTNNFAELDHLLVSKTWHNNVINIRSHPQIALATHHFLVTADLNIQIERGRPSGNKLTHDLSSLQRQSIAVSFANSFTNHLYSGGYHDSNCFNDLEQAAGMFAQSMVEAVTDTVPMVAAKRNKPWISSNTLDLISQG